jgi:hypothetical protein
MSALTEAKKSIASSVESELSNLSKVPLADISTTGNSASYAVIDRVIKESHVKPVPVASFGSSI